DLVRVGHAGDLDDDPVGAAGDDDRLRHAGRVHPPLDDALDDIQVVEGRGLVADGLHLVLDLEPAPEVEAQLRLDDATRALAAEVGQGQARHEVDQDGEHAEDGDEDQPGSAHERGCYRSEAPGSFGRAASRLDLIWAASFGPIPGTAAICSTG